MTCWDMLYTPFSSEPWQTLWMQVKGSDAKSTEVRVQTWWTPFLNKIWAQKRKQSLQLTYSVWTKLFMKRVHMLHAFSFAQFVALWWFSFDFLLLELCGDPQFSQTDTFFPDKEAKPPPSAVRTSSYENLPGDSKERQNDITWHVPN